MIFAVCRASLLDEKFSVYGDVVGTVRERSIAKVEIKNNKIKRKRRVPYVSTGGDEKSTGFLPMRIPARAAE